MKKGENIFFSNFFPKMFFEKLNFFQKYQSAQNVQVGGAPVNLQHMRPLFIGNSWSFPGGTHSKGTVLGPGFSLEKISPLQYLLLYVVINYCSYCHLFI